ncbi:family 16 glycosylhydrolase [Acidithiobacillus thiooxidans]|uniref:family 16 glycosylhydrolase n=7 Tax=Acidithiobacillus TaxID=119977 RepID=UPI0034A5223B
MLGIGGSPINKSSIVTAVSFRMNLSKPLRMVSRLLYSLFLQGRLHLQRQQCLAFVSHSDVRQTGIDPIFVINLDRQPDRWTAIYRELGHIMDAAGNPLSERAIRYSACDALTNPDELFGTADITPYYTLGDQLFVEPQPDAVPDAFDLERPIRMSDAEVAIARSHIDIWKTIATSDASYTLVLEDDVWFGHDFGQLVDQAWSEMKVANCARPAFDMLYLSYQEVRHGAPKEFVSKTVFRPERGLWYLSGYVLSKKGALLLLELLPCRGPVDLWINHMFREMDVRALRRSVISQRLDLSSTNSYSILPTLSRIGIIDGGNTALFQRRPTCSPVFAFGASGFRMSSLAMALLMLGYRCCSDFDRIPECELDSLLNGRTDRVFDAYVNIESLVPHARVLTQRFPHAKFIVIDEVAGAAEALDGGALEGADVLRLYGETPNTWRGLCEHLKVAPPIAPYPSVRYFGQRRYRSASVDELTTRPAKQLRHDQSPWIVEPRASWKGIRASAFNQMEASFSSRVIFEDNLADIQPARWLLRNDTFPGNLGLFRPANVIPQLSGGLSLTVIKEPLGVRNLSAAAVSSRSNFLFGRFEVALQATNVPGLVTGFFLHRESPRQEIDVEITGNRPDRLLVNVFYNPGSEGAKFDYGYRGTPVSIPLGFDASKTLHRFAIEWDPCFVRWFVDGELVHCRVTWGPTPIPHLPMTLHVNTWPTRSHELAGRLALRALPASAIVRRISVDSFNADTRPQLASVPEDI